MTDPRDPNEYLADDADYLDDDVYREDDGDYDTGRWVEWEGPTSKSRRVLVTIAAILVVIALAAGGLYVWVQRQIDPPGGPGADVELVIEQGSTTEGIGRLLADEGIIANASVWNFYMRFNDEGPFQAGIYVLPKNSSFQEAIDILDAGPRPPESVRITIPEGLTVTEILPRLADPATGVADWELGVLEAALAAGDIRSAFQPDDATSMEGLLFPETYAVGEDETERSFLRRLVGQLDTVLIQLDVQERSAALGLTPYEIIIVASLIEEEARVEGDRTKISRVIHNRLEQGIPLGIDATNRYEAELAGRSRDDIDFSSDSPYNTRRVRGLPPTPIAAPGRASLDAVLNPADGSWTFYVLKNTQGEHFFTDSNNEFLRAKEECRRQGLGCG